MRGFCRTMARPKQYRSLYRHARQLSRRASIRCSGGPRGEVTITDWATGFLAVMGCVREPREALRSIRSAKVRSGR